MDFKGAFTCLLDSDDEIKQQQSLKEMLLSDEMKRVPPTKRAKLARDLLLQKLKDRSIPKDVMETVSQGIDDIISFMWSYVNEDY